MPFSPTDSVPRMPSRSQRGLFTALAAMAVLLWAPATLAVDWQKVSAHEITLFYPGQNSWEWLLTPTDHAGASGIRKGNNCGTCHDGQQSDMGKAIAARTGLAPIGGANSTPGSLSLNVQTAWDNERFYLRASWPVRGAGDKPSLFTVMLDDGQVTEATRAGCWGACHDDMQGMVSAAAGATRSKYLVASRTKVTRKGGGDNLKSASELAALLAQGKFLEYWQVQIGPGATTKPRIADGYILEQRHLHPHTAVSAQASQADGRWIIELSRPRTIDAPGRKTLVTGNTYTLGFAVHEAGNDGRFHYVSLGYSLVLAPGTADLIAPRVD